MGSINPEVLEWARIDAALSLQEAAEKLGFKDSRLSEASEKLRAIESGEVEVSKSQLEKMSRVYRKSLLVLYSSQIPKKQEIAMDFRKKISTVTEREESLLDTMILDYSVRQSILVGSITEDEDYRPLTFIGSSNIQASTEIIKNLVMSVTGFHLKIYRESKTIDDAFNYARKCVENSGTFVILAGNLGSYHTTLSTDVFRGFSLVDNFAPIVVINSNDAKGALVFTLFHEFTHLILGQSSVSNGNDSLEIERVCDRVAGDLLINISDYESFHLDTNADFEQALTAVEDFANKVKLSYTAAAYNLLKRKFIDKQLYERLEIYYREKYFADRREKGKEKKKGPKYQVLKNYQNGKLLTGTVSELLGDGSMTYRDASKVLGANQMTLHTLLIS